MALIKYDEWLAKHQESTAFTRARREIALGLRTPTGMGSIHRHSTARPWEVEAITKRLKKKPSKKKRTE